MYAQGLPNFFIVGLSPGKCLKDLLPNANAKPEPHRAVPNGVAGSQHFIALLSKRQVVLRAKAEYPPLGVSRWLSFDGANQWDQNPSVCSEGWFEIGV
jgi:hypothetical protein